MKKKKNMTQQELADKLSEYLSKQSKVFPLYILGMVTLSVTCRYDNNMPEVLVGMLLTVSIISNWDYFEEIQKHTNEK